MLLMRNLLNRIQLIYNVCFIRSYIELVSVRKFSLLFSQWKVLDFHFLVFLSSVCWNWNPFICLGMDLDILICMLLCFICNYHHSRDEGVKRFYRKYVRRHATRDRSDGVRSPLLWMRKKMKMNSLTRVMQNWIQFRYSEMPFVVSALQFQYLSLSLKAIVL